MTDQKSGNEKVKHILTFSSFAANIKFPFYFTVNMKGKITCLKKIEKTVKEHIENFNYIMIFVNKTIIPYFIVHIF